MSVELSLTLPFYLFSAIFVAISYSLNKKQIGQKIFFTGIGWLFSIIGMAGVHNIANKAGYTGIVDLATAVMIIGTVGLIVWFIFVVVNAFTDFSLKIFGRLGR